MRASRFRGSLVGASITALALCSSELWAQLAPVNHPELDWRTIETEHFYVHYHHGTERSGRAVAKIAEEVYGPITRLYRHDPDGKVHFVVKDKDDYSNGDARRAESSIGHSSATSIRRRDFGNFGSALTAASS